MSQPSSKSLSELLANVHAGDDKSLKAVLPLAYDELRRVAHRYLLKERSSHTLQSTALVHEAYVRLQKQSIVKFENREHFFALCAQLMRQILVEYARSRGAANRDGGQRLTLDDSLNLGKGRNLDFSALNDALNGLVRLDAQQSRIVELRFFAGLSVEETSRVLGISPASVKRDWATARVWLHHEIARSSET